MESRPQKLAKLTTLRKSIPHCSKSALHKILHYVKEQGVPDMIYPHQMAEGCQEVIQNMSAYGPLIAHHKVMAKTGVEKTISLVNLLSWIHGAFKAGGGFYALLKQTMNKCDSALSLCLYADEITPGNVLANQPTRKLWAIYATIKEFGCAIQNESAWITLGLVRSSIVSSLDGHLSQVFAVLLNSIFNNPCANVTDLGLQLQEPGGGQPCPKRLKLQVGFFIMDGQAAKFAWSTKGDAGSRFCQHCANVFQLAADDVNDEENGHMSEVSKYTHFSQLHLVESHEIFQSWDRMSARHGATSKQEFAMWEQAAGLSYSPYSLLAKQDLRHVLRPADQNCWDWMHCLLSNGVVNIAAFKWLEVLGEWELLHGYVQKFVLPKAFNTIQLKTILDSKRLPKHRAHGKINATASELLTLCSVLAHFARTVCVPANVHIQETNLFWPWFCFWICYKLLGMAKFDLQT